MEAQQEIEIDDFTDCPDCRAIADTGDDETPFKDIPRTMHEAMLVLGFPGVVTKTTYRHRAAKIIQPYVVDQRIACSLPRRHRHKSGAIVLTKCGLLIRLGHRCAERSVHNWHAVHEHYQAAVRRIEKEDTVRKGAVASADARVLLARLEDLCAKSATLMQANGYLRWARMMRNSAGSIPPKRGTAPEFRVRRGRDYQPGDETVRIVETEQHAVGQEFLDSWEPGQRSRIDATRKVVGRLVWLTTASVGELDLAALTDLALEVEAASAMLSEQNTWCNLGDLFFSPANLGLIESVYKEHKHGRSN